jgi:hypothetical protein
LHDQYCDGAASLIGGASGTGIIEGAMAKNGGLFTHYQFDIGHPQGSSPICPPPMVVHVVCQVK